VSCTWGVPGQQTRRGWITVLDVNPETEISESCYPGQRFPMSGMSVTVGRDDTADVCVDSPAVSRLALWVHEGDDGQWRAMRRGKCAVEVDGKTLERGEKVTFLEGDPIVLNYAVTLCVGDPAGVPRRVLQPVSVNEAGVLQPPGPSLVALRVPDWGFSCYGSGRQAEVVRIALPCVAEEHFEIWRQVHRGADRVLVRPIAAAPLYLLLPGGADDAWTRVSGGWAESPAGSRLNLGRLTLELR